MNKKELKLSKIKALASQTERMKKDLKEKDVGKGSNDFGQYGQGLSDDYDVDMLKNVNYNQLKEIVEKF